MQYTFCIYPNIRHHVYPCYTCMRDIYCYFYTFPGQLTCIRELNATFQKNESGTILKLIWTEPTATENANQVDFYSLTVNQINYNTTETSTSVILPENKTSATISLAASNCVGSTPPTVVHFLLFNNYRGNIITTGLCINCTLCCFLLTV